MRPIDADALKRRLEGWPSEFFDYDELVPLIDEQPTLSPDEVRGVGEWLTEYEPNGRPYQFHCSVCDSDFSQMGITHASNYCPSCGARMKGAEDGTTDAE